MHNHFCLEEYIGCCAFLILFDLPQEANKPNIVRLKAAIEEARNGSAYDEFDEGGAGGLWVTLNHHQVPVWEPVLKHEGFVCLVSDVMNPNSGNTVSTYFLNFHADAPDLDDD